MSRELLSRREALARLALILGGAVIGAEAFAQGIPVKNKTLTTAFTPGDLALLEDIAEIIIPTTDTPGAKAVGISGFIATMVNDCYDDGHHALFMAGLKTIDAQAKARYGTDFSASTLAQRTELLSALDREQASPQPTKAPHYFRLLKQLVVLGYFTSEIGATKALRYVETPGGYNGNVPYKRGDRAWFSAPGPNL